MMFGVRSLLRLLLGRGLLLPGQLLRVGAEPLHLGTGTLATLAHYTHKSLMEGLQISMDR